MNETIHILVADDHPIVREGLANVLETQEDFIVLGQAADGLEALQLLEKYPKTEVLLLDLEMPNMDGVALIQEIKKRQLPIQVIIFTVFDTDDRIISAIKAGAKGYLLKGASREEIFQAIRVVHGGGSLLQPVIASKLFQHISEGNETLTSRELEVLITLAEGQTNKQIADQLFISERTVKFHVSAILNKLGAHNRTEAVKIAAERGLISR